MAFTTRPKTPCSRCSKAAGILTCRGCDKDFCYHHVAEHREELNKQMDEVTTNHDQLQQTITEQQAQPKCHPLMKQIDIWEQNSIEKIHQAAKEAREQLLIVVDKHRTKVADALTLLTQELTKARNNDDYVETDLNEWIEKIEKLKIDLAAAQAIDFGQDNNEASLIPKIFINDILNDSFEKWFGDIQTTDHGKLILHGQTNQTAAVYSKGAYSSGQHQFRFKIEHLRTNQGFFFSIVSNDMDMDMSSRQFIKFNSMKFEKAFDLTGGYHQNGISLFSLSGYNNVIQTNDILEFQIDCDHQRIRVINERTNYQKEFSTNLARCKLPWRMAIVLHHASDCVQTYFIKHRVYLQKFLLRHV
jgi:hypothetical protein